MQDLTFFSNCSNLILRLGRAMAVLGLIFLVSACQEKTSEEHILEAQQFTENGNVAAAIVALKNAAQKEPRSAQVRFELGKLYLEVESYEDAEKELSRALELGYDELVVTPLLAVALQRTGANVALADLDYQNSALTGAEKMEIGFRQIGSLIQLNKESEARNLIADLLQLDSNTVYRGLVQAYDYILREELMRALEKSKEMYARAPLNRDVLNFTARLYQINNMPEEAAKVYQNYIIVAPRDVESKFALASMLVDQRKTEEAEVYIDELMELNENNPMLNQMKGIVRAAAKDFKNAKVFAENAIRFGRNDPVNRIIAGLSSYQLEDYEASVEHFSVIASILPDDHPGLRILAASQLKSNMGDEAGQILSRVQAVEGDDASLFSRAGYELLRSGNTEAAKNIVEQADRISASAKDLTRLGILKLSLNDLEGLVDLEEAVAQEPESRTAKTTLASAYLGTNQLDKAMELAKTWQGDEPQSVEGFILESEVLQRQEQYDDAESVINKALALDAKNIPARLAEVRLGMRQKAYEQSLTKIESVLLDAPSSLPALAIYFALKDQLNQRDEGIAYLKKAAEDYADNLNVAILYARVAVNFNQAQQALDALANIEADRTTPVSYWPVKGTALIKSNKADEALDHYELWANFYPNQENAVLGQLLVLDAKRDYQKGANVSTDFLTRKDSIQVKIMNSYFLIMANELEKGKEVYDSIDASYKALPFLRGVNARINLLEGKPYEALEDAKVAYEQNTSINNMILYVNALDGVGRENESLQVIKAFSERFPNDGRAKLLLGEKQIKVDEAGAIATYKDVLLTYPNNFVVLNNLAYLLMDVGELNDAYEYANRAYTIQPNNLAIADTYAQVLIKRGEIAEAVDVYNRAMSNKVNNDEISLNYIEALLKNDNITIAKRRIENLKLNTDEGKARLQDLQDTYLN